MLDPLKRDNVKRSDRLQGRLFRDKRVKNKRILSVSIATRESENFINCIQNCVQRMTTISPESRKFPTVRSLGRRPNSRVRVEVEGSMKIGNIDRYVCTVVALQVTGRKIL